MFTKSSSTLQTSSANNKALACWAMLAGGLSGTVCMAQENAAAAQAQEAARTDQQTALELNTIVVTASRRAEDLQDVPMAVSVFRPEDAVNVGFTNIKDVADYLPGINMQQSASPGGGLITVRGVGQVGSTATVGVYIDDTLINNSGPWGLGGGYIFDGLLLDIERVEFLKGPQGTLYGSTSVGGAVRYITRKPSLDGLRGHASLDVSTMSGGGDSKIYSGRLSAPLVENKLGITVAGYFEDNGGYIDRLDATGALVTKNADEYEKYGYSADLYYHFSDNLEFRLKALDQQVDYAGARFAILQCPDGAGCSDAAFLAAADGAPKLPVAGLSNRVPFFHEWLYDTVYSATLQYRFHGMTLTSTSSHVESAYMARVNRSDLAEFYDLLAGREPGTSTDMPVSSSRPQEKFTQEITLRSDDAGAFEWLAGLYYTDESTENRARLTLVPDDFLFEDHTALSNYQEYALFGNVTYRFTPRFHATLGGRVSRNEMDFQAITLSDFGDTVGVKTAVEDTVDTWSLALAYQPTDNLSVYGRIATGYRPAAANQPPVIPDPRVQLLVKSDSVLSYEIGAKGHTADNLLSYDVAVWYTKWEDFQASLTLLPAFDTALGNANGGITGKGVEAALSIRPIRGLSIQPSVSYADSTVDQDEPNLFALAGQQLPGVPEWSASMKLDYEFAAAGSSVVRFGAGIRYVGEKRSTFEDSSSQIYDWPTEEYTLVDLHAGVSFDRYTVNAYATNVFDELRYIAIRAPALTVGSQPSAVPTRPRTIGVNVTFAF